MRPIGLVLGAGASKIFGLPLGSELKDKIAEDLEIKFDTFGHSLERGSYALVEALRIINRDEHGRQQSINPHRAAAVEISDAMALSSSIDEYVERHKSDILKAECAKLAIAKAIIEAERNSKLFIDPMAEDGRPLHATSSSWLAAFLRDITRGYTSENVNEAFDDLTVINFNYDRCFEHFVYEWLQRIYRLSAQEAARITIGLGTYHPYGRLGPLPWEDQKEGVPYGGALESHRLIKMSRRIRTYSEAIEPESGLDFIKDRLSECGSVVFLGFGFHQQNLDLLSLNTDLNRGSLRCYATRSGISEPRWDVMKDRVRSAFGIPPHRDLYAYGFDGHCEKFWEEFSDVILA